MYKLIAFDLDGTVADTLSDLAGAMNYALAQKGLVTYPVEDYRHFVGNGIDRLVKDTMGAAYTPEEAKLVKADFQKYYTEHCRDLTTAYDGMAELLKKLSDKGYRTAVISNKPNMFVPEILSELYPDHRFEYAWGQQENVARKPDPEALYLLMKLADVKADEILYVGDSNVDVRFAHSAGVKVCGVSWGFRGAEELQDEGADFIVNSAKELYEVITNE